MKVPKHTHTHTLHMCQPIQKQTLWKYPLLNRLELLDFIKAWQTHFHLSCALVPSTGQDSYIFSCTQSPLHFSLQIGPNFQILRTENRVTKIKHQSFLVKYCNREFRKSVWETKACLSVRDPSHTASVTVQLSLM